MRTSRHNLEPTRVASTALKMAAGGVGVGLVMRRQHQQAQQRLAREADQRVASVEEKLAKEKEDSKLDPKTKLLNWNAFETEIIKRTGSTEREADQDKVHVLALLDLDDFKAWNTRISHRAADKKALIPTANILRDGMRPDGDLAGRLGGEEFVLFLGETDAEGAAVVCERDQASINELQPDENAPDRLGATIVYTTFRQGDYPESLDSIMNYLSETLHVAKKSEGKNQIVYAPPLEGDQLQLFRPDQRTSIAPVDAD